MIDIDKIGECNSVSYPYDFPTIDFKFVNRSKVTAVLWQFTITVVDASVDLTPELEFGYRIPWDFDERKTRRDLIVTVANNWWGNVENIYAIVVDPILKQLYPGERRTFNGQIESGQTKEIIKFEVSDIKPDLLNKLLAEQTKRNAKQNAQAIKEASESILKQKDETDARVLRFRSLAMRGALGDQLSIGLPLELTYVDQSGCVFKGKADAMRGRKSWPSIHLSGDGFREEHFGPLILCCAMHSFATYCVLIDPSDGRQERNYKISRQIAPGAAERFHIMVGASKSCSMTLKFRFSVNDDQVVDSEEFRLEIHNPRNSRLHGKYADGDAMKRQPETDPEDSSHDDVLWKAIRRYLIGRPHSEYPFHKPGQKD